MNLSLFAKSLAVNITLAVIPVVAAYLIVWVSRLTKKTGWRLLLITPLTLLWLVFLPNTCYLLTEWRHLFERVSCDLIYRAQTDKILLVQLSTVMLFYMLYSGFGMLTFALAIRPVRRLATKRGVSIWFWAFPFFAAVSLGVYLGLVLRFNSWDLAMNPEVVWAAIVEIGGRPWLATFIAAFGIFLWIGYETVDIWIDGFINRLSQITGRNLHLTSGR